MQCVFCQSLCQLFLTVYSGSSAPRALCRLKKPFKCLSTRQLNRLREQKRIKCFPGMMGSLICPVGAYIKYARRPGGRGGHPNACRLVQGGGGGHSLACARIKGLELKTIFYKPPKNEPSLPQTVQAFRPLTFTNLQTNLYNSFQ